MGADGPRETNLPQIGEDDASLRQSEPEGRWSTPYISGKTGSPTVFTRRPLTPAEVAFGLKSCLSADTLERLKTLMAQEDEKHGDYLSSQGKG